VKRAILLDAGPLVAFFARQDEHHEWAASILQSLPYPLLTCEPVLSEACHLVKRLRGGAEAVLDLLERGAVRVGFSVQENARSLSDLIRKYEDAPMSLADACLVRMAETIEGAAVITIDSHFRTYRLHGRQVIPTIMPPAV
jgi:uncharacterized protein